MRRIVAGYAKVSPGTISDLLVRADRDEIAGVHDDVAEGAEPFRLRLFEGLAFQIAARQHPRLICPQ